MARKKKPTTRRARKFTGDTYYVGCKQLDSYITDCAPNNLIGSFEAAEKRAQDSVNADGKPRYIVKVVAKVERIAPPLKTTAL